MIEKNHFTHFLSENKNSTFENINKVRQSLAQALSDHEFGFFEDNINTLASVNSKIIEWPINDHFSFSVESNEDILLLTLTYLINVESNKIQEDRALLIDHLACANCTNGMQLPFIAAISDDREKTLLILRIERKNISIPTLLDAYDQLISFGK